MTAPHPTSDLTPALRRRLRRPRRHAPVTIWVAGIFLAAVMVLVVAADWLVPDAMAQDVPLGSTPAGTPGHPLGTDDLGRDILSMSLAGARLALVGPIVIAVGSLLLGLVLGSLAGYLGGWVDGIVSRWADLVLALPGLLLAIVVAGVMDGGYWMTVSLLILLFSPSDIRIIRSAVLGERHKPYIEAPQVLGLSTPRIVVRHVWPNIAPIVGANFFLNIAYALVALSSLSYLGLGVAPTDADWGRQLSDARNLLFSNPAAVVVPGLLIIATATAINLLGDRVADRHSLPEVVR